MQTLRDVLQEAARRRTGVGHFNFSDLITLQAIAESARELNAPVIVGVSEGERKFMGVPQVAALVRSIRGEYDWPIFLNADHTHSLEGALEAARVAFDLICSDNSSLGFEENVARTRRAVEAVKAINASILIEGEIGDIGSGSELHEAVPASSRILSTAEQAKEFVDGTGVDVLAPAVGNMHGMLRSMARGEERKHLDIGRIAEIKAATGIFLTLHGGSGTDDQDLSDAVQAGINIVHINTELRLAWRRGLESSLAGKPNELAPYKILEAPRNAVRAVVHERILLFSSKPPGSSTATPGSLETQQRKAS